MGALAYDRCDTRERRTMTDTPATSGPTAPVPKDPQPSVDRIDGLANRILTGDILLPKFQRSFVWERPQIIALLDSVGRGYPIGSVLLWQSRQELRSESRIADLEIQLPKPDYPVNYLLDGQQRLSTICAAMYWNGTDPRSRWNLAYDLRAQEFVHLDTLDDPAPYRIRLNRLSDAARYFTHVGALDSSGMEDREELKERANALFNRFKDYKIATVTLGDMAIEDVAPIFERINSTGTPLTIVDLMRAATWSPDFDLIETIDSLLAALGAKDFGDIDKKVVLRNLSAAAGGGFSTDSIDDLRKRSAEGLRAAANDVRQAYLRMVDYLTTQIRIPRSQIVPYVNQLTVLAEVFRQVPAPTAEQYRAIDKWFWQTALSGYFSGWNTGMMAADLSAVSKFTTGETNEIRASVMAPTAQLWTARQFRSNNAHAKLLAIVLSHREPTDLLTGQRIDTRAALAWTNQKEFHHFFPRDYLSGRGVVQQRINSLANIVMLTSDSNKKITNRAPSDYLVDVEAALGNALEEALDRNLISQEAFEAARQDDFERFLALRAKTIHARVMDLAGWAAEAESQPPLNVEVTGDGSETLEAQAEAPDYTYEPPARDAVAATGEAFAGNPFVERVRRSRPSS